MREHLTLEHRLRIKKIREHVNSITPGRWDYGIRENFEDLSKEPTWLASSSDTKQGEIARFAKPAEGCVDEMVSNADFICNAPYYINYLLNLVKDLYT